MKQAKLAIIVAAFSLAVTGCQGTGTAPASGGSAGTIAAETTAAETTAEAASAETKEDAAAVETTTAAEKVKETAAETAAETSPAAQETPAESSEAAETEKAENEDGTYEIYQDMDGIIFGFLSGVGAWETTLEVAPDGSFSGQFYDANMGEDGEGYKNGTIYECAFTGRFSAPEKVDETSYSAKVEELNYEKERNGSDRYIEDDTLHILTNPYGLGLGDDILIYTPDKKVSELSEGFMSWMLWKIPDDAKELGAISIYNTSGDYVFYPDTYAMSAAEPAPVEESAETSAYRDIKQAYYNQAMPSYVRTPYVPSLPQAPPEPYQSVTLENLQGRWVNRYQDGGEDVVEVLSVNGDMGRIETWIGGKKRGVWNGEGYVTITDRSERNVCPAFRIDQEDGSNLCTIYIRWVNSNAFYDGLFQNEWKREGNSDPDQYLYDTVTLENLQGVWYTESQDSGGLDQVVLTVDEDRAVLFETIDGEISRFWNGGGKSSIEFANIQAGISVPELIVNMEHGPSVGGSAGIYISSVNEYAFYDCGFNRWYVKVGPDFLEEQESMEDWGNEEWLEGGGVSFQRTYHYVVKPTGGIQEEGKATEWSIEITGDEGLNEMLNFSVDPDSIHVPYANEVVSEDDVNFDGIPDVMLYRGTLGAHGVSFYDCYLSDGSSLKKCVGFDEIPDPTTDPGTKQIYGHIRDGAAAFYSLSYRVDGDQVVQTEEVRYVYDEAKNDYVPES